MVTKQLVKFMCCFLVVTLVRLCFADGQIDLNDLSELELKRKIAKLFVVGIETDYANSSSSSRLEELISEVGIGGVMLNAYNFPPTELSKDDSRENAFHSAKNLFLPIQRYAESSDNMPLVFVDFESRRYSSIKYPLISPPSALTLGSTGDTSYAYYVGRAVAYQLSRLGVDVILGPVLDSDNASSQDSLNSTIKTRSFSDNLDVISLFARRYMEGLKSVGIGVIGKHLPSYSAVTGNPHGSITRFSGSLEQIERNARPFQDNYDLMDGIMTSHLIIDELGSKPFTLNKQAMTTILSDSFGESFNSGGHIFITDDLSEMDATLEYMKSVNIGYEDVALEAFKAGHDLLLFSHIGSKDKHQFHYDDLIKAIDNIYNYVLSNSDGFTRLARSLIKIEDFKTRLRVSRSEVFDSKILDYSSSQIFADSNFNNLDSFLASLYNSATISLKNEQFPSLAIHPTDTKYTIFASQASFNIFTSEFKSNPQVSVKSFDAQESSNTVDVIQGRIDKILEALNASDFVYVVVEDVDDVNTIHYFAYKETRYLNNLVFLIHENPKILKKQILARSDYVFGNFSRSDEAYLADTRLIKGDFLPNSVRQLPIELNDGQLHRMEDFSRPKDKFVLDGEVEIFNTNRERELSEEIDTLKEDKSELNATISKLEQRMLDSQIMYESNSGKVLNSRVELGFTVPALLFLFFSILLITCVFLGAYMSKISDNTTNSQTCWVYLRNAFKWGVSDKKKTMLFLLFLFVLMFFFIFPKDSGMKYLLDVARDVPYLGYVVVVLEDVYPGDFYLDKKYVFEN